MPGMGPGMREGINMADMSPRLTLDDTLAREIDAMAETYWRWAVTPDDNPLASIVNDLSPALTSVLTALAPEGTDGAAFAAWVRQTFSDCHGEPNRSMTECMAMALLPQVRGGWDATWVTCDYCTVRATRVTDSDEPLCEACAKDHYGAEWRMETRTLGMKALKRLK